MNENIAAASVHCDLQTMLFAVSKVRLHTILTLLVALQTILGQRQRAGTLCVRRLQLRCGNSLDDGFDHVNLQPTLLSETMSMVPAQTSRAEYARGLN